MEPKVTIDLKEYEELLIFKDFITNPKNSGVQVVSHYSYVASNYSQGTYTNISTIVYGKDEVIGMIKKELDTERGISKERLVAMNTLREEINLLQKSKNKRGFWSSWFQ